MIKWAVGLFLGGVVLLTGVQVVPVYVNNLAVKKIVKEVIADTSLRSRPKREVLKALEGQFRNRELDLVPGEVVKVARDKNGDLVLDVKYEERRKLMYNLEIVAGFDEQFTN